jgi:hypothetical protein
MRSADDRIKPIVAEMTTTGFFVPLKQVFFENNSYFRPEMRGLNLKSMKVEKLKKRLICALRVYSDAWSCKGRNPDAKTSNISSEHCDFGHLIMPESDV